MELTLIKPQPLLPLTYAEWSNFLVLLLEISTLGYLWFCLGVIVMLVPLFLE